MASEPMRHPHCTDYPEIESHLWRASGYYLMREVELQGDLGSSIGVAMTGGSKSRLEERTPEVEVCVRCGLLRLRQGEQK